MILSIILKKLGDKYIIFKRLLIEAKNDTTFKATLDAINHFLKDYRT